VGDVDRGRFQLRLQPRHLGPHLHAQLGVEVGERLVHQEGFRVAHDRPAHRHPLALPAGEVGRAAVEVGDEVERPRRLLHLALDLLLLGARQLQCEAHVLAHGHVRVEGVVLEDHRDVAVFRRAVVHLLAADLQLAFGDVLEPGDHPQRGRLAAARGADEDHELAVADLEVHLFDGFLAVGEDLGHSFEGYL